MSPDHRNVGPVSQSLHKFQEVIKISIYLNFINYHLALKLFSCIDRINSNLYGPLAILHISWSTYIIYFVIRLLHFVQIYIISVEFGWLIIYNCMISTSTLLLWSLPKYFSFDYVSNQTSNAPLVAANVIGALNIQILIPRSLLSNPVTKVVVKHWIKLHYVKYINYIMHVKTLVSQQCLILKALFCSSYFIYCFYQHFL